VRRLMLVFLLVGVVGVLFVGSFRFAGGGAGCSGDVVGFVAPTLMRVVSDAVAEAGLSGGGLLSIGSVEGLRRMQQGVLPDIYGSVDIELLRDVDGMGPRQVFVLGRFGMGLVCRSPVVSPGDLGGRVVALADPNKAPIGYRALALAWMLKRDGVVDLVSRFERLGVGYLEARGVNITVPAVLTPTRDVQVAANLDAAWSMLEVGAVDCTFAHMPFILGKFSRLEEVDNSSVWAAYRGVHGGRTYYVYFFNGAYSFLDDPPYEIYVLFTSQGGGVVRGLRVVGFGAFVASFSEKGDCVVDVLRRMDLSGYGFVR